MKKTFLIVVCLLCVGILFGCSEKKEEEIKVGKVTCEEKNKLLKQDNSVLIDVRTTLEYNEGHLDNAINIPLDNLVEDIKVVNNINFDTKIIVYCKSGARSAQAADKLKKAGYNKVYDLGAKTNCSK